MDDLAQLLTAIAGLVTAIAGAVALVITTVRTSRRERPAAARQLLARLAEAAKDGDITPEELAEIAGTDEEGP